MPMKKQRRVPRNDAHTEEPTDTRTIRRAIVLLVFVAFLFSALLVRILLLQTVQYRKYEQKVIDQLTTESEVRARRGNIYDANGTLLASNVTSYRIFLAPHRIAYAQSEANRNGEKTDYSKMISEELSAILGVSREHLEEEISKTKYLDRTIARNVTEEVADRICAKPGTKDYGAITAVIGYYASAQKLFRVPAEKFVPVPKVNSAVVKLTLWPDDAKPCRPRSEETFFKTVKAAFGQRRKTLANALSTGFPELPKETIMGAISSLGLDPLIRGECLSVAQFSDLSDLLFRDR